ncbi:ssDNA-binding protein [Magnetofaba australis]|uniref:Uncharacterized protein n=1 Tax=Magnetofaba australis IT-1 TaxID=1434232 RepID=A0A1Y2JZ83_9PROT|nr:ssDNA-binding protein [Magnetofaba australis]OSM00196.1 hypothetical protein MAIT1_00653 [Magnetofaba australis IT-1]
MRDTPIIVTPIFQAAFVNLFPTPYSAYADTPAYRITMLFDQQADLSALTQGIEEVAAQQGLDPHAATFDHPLRRQTLFRRRDAHWTARAVNAEPPTVLDAYALPLQFPQTLYGGCYARAALRPIPNDATQPPGVSLQLLSVQKVAEGELMQVTPESCHHPCESMPSLEHN